MSDSFNRKETEADRMEEQHFREIARIHNQGERNKEHHITPEQAKKEHQLPHWGDGKGK